MLTRARGRYECCGAHAHQRALEVDHIIPKNQGGSDAISNLQALCFRCNAGKRDPGSYDFRVFDDPLALHDAIIRNTYRTLMSRGTKACWVFASDPELNQWLKQAAGMGS